MKIGFTGTRSCMTDVQRATFGTMLTLNFDPAEFHHGACKGADAEAAALVRYIHSDGVCVVAHPGQSAKGGDNEWLSEEALADADETRPTLTHFARNRKLVDETDMLFATPKDDAPQAMGGTWYTVGYATKKGKPVIIIYPNGSVERRNEKGSVS